MRFLPVLMAALAALACPGMWTGPAVAADEAPARTVVAAADFVLADVTKADPAGKAVLLDFWASWCKPCKLSMPWLSQMQRKYAAQGLQIVAVSVDKDEAEMRARLGEIDPGIVVVFDPQGKLAAQYELEGMPASFLIDRAGKVTATHVGFREAEIAAREADIAKLVEGGQ